MPPRRAKAGPSRVPPPLPTTYPGKKDGKGMEENAWEACRIMLEGVYDAKDGSRYMSEIFRELPDKKLYADYYESIPEPQALDDLANDLGQAGLFTTPEDFFKLLHLVFLNAKHYNEEGSQVWNDAKAFEDRIHEAWKANTSTGAFSNPDPYHQTPIKKKGRARKSDRAASTGSRTSATPAPAPAPAPAEPAPSSTRNLIIHLPTVVETGSASPTPPAIPPVTVTRQSPAKAVMHLPPTLAAVPPVAVATPPIAMPLPPSQPLGVNNQTTPAALITPPSPTASERMKRKTQADSDARVIANLELKLPRWTGPQLVLPGPSSSGGISGSGWFGEGIARGYEHVGSNGQPFSIRIRTILSALGHYKDHLGIRLASVFDLLPPSFDMPYLSFHVAVTFDAICKASFSNLQEFDMQMVRLFEKCRRYFPEGSVEYGRILILQRLYNALTAPYPLAVPPNGLVPPNSGNFASLPAGPGNARSMHEANQDLKAGVDAKEVGYGVTTFRVSSKDRVFTDEARLKGVAYKTGDFVHLINPDDATKPIVGQIFKTFVPTKGYLTHHVTVCWYFRPEQIVHTARRTFFEREVFKTSHFCDHPVEDIIERISCQFFVKYVRGRPQAPEYYPGWPIYVCHARYNDKAWATVRIKNWASCIPDELRQTDFMNIIPFEKQIDPQTVKSPFLRGIKGPGFFAEARQEFAEDYDDDEDYDKGRRTAGSGRKGRPPGPVATASYQSAVGTPSPGPGGYPTVPAPHQGSYGAGSPLPRGQPQQPVTARPGYQSSPANLSYRGPTPSAPQAQYNRGQPPSVATATPGGSQTPQNLQSGYQQPRQQAPPAHQFSSSSRSITAAISAFTGSTPIEQLVMREYLPMEVVRLFERDSRGQILWFSGPPLPPGTIPIPSRPPHSLEYLEYLTKKKRGIKEVDGNGNGKGDEIDEIDQKKKSAKRYTYQSPSEEDKLIDESEDSGDKIFEEMWWAQGQSENEVFNALKAVIDGL